MAELRKMKFAENRWYVVDDSQDKWQLIGSLVLVPTSAVLKWQAEFSPVWGAPEDLAVGYFETEMEALDFLERHVKGEP